MQLKPLITTLRDEAAAVRRLPDALAAAFFEADLYRIVVPTDLGGAGCDPVTLVDVIEEASSYDASAGWNLAIGAGNVSVCGGLPLEKP